MTVNLPERLPNPERRATGGLDGFRHSRTGKTECNCESRESEETVSVGADFRIAIPGRSRDERPTYQRRQPPSSQNAMLRPDSSHIGKGNTARSPTQISDSLLLGSPFLFCAVHHQLPDFSRITFGPGCGGPFEAFLNFVLKPDHPSLALIMLLQQAKSVAHYLVGRFV